MLFDGLAGILGTSVRIIIVAMLNIFDVSFMAVIVHNA